MPSLSYNGRFVDYVEAGLQPKPKGRVKRQTLRSFRKRPFKSGDTLYHFYGLRTAFSRRLGTSIAKSVHAVKLTSKSITIDKHKLTNKAELNQFAYEDGFDSWEQLQRFWKIAHGKECFPFRGQLIKW